MFFTKPNKKAVSSDIFEEKLVGKERVTMPQYLQGGHVFLSLYRLSL